MPITPQTWPGTPITTPVVEHTRRFWVELDGRAISLPRGEVLIGRSPACLLSLSDMLVSRQHARLLVSTDAVFVEDVASTNGVLVNESLIDGATRLEESDRVMIGAHQLVLRSAPAGADDAVPASSQMTPEVASSGRRPVARVPLRTTVTAPVVDCEAPVSTEKADGLATMARLADRMITMGRPDAAARLVGDHLRGVLTSVRQGRSVPSHVLDTVGHYGMKLTDLTRDVEYANIALEVHLLSRRPLPANAVPVLESLAARVVLDRKLVLAYKAVLRAILPVFGKVEQDLIGRILRLPNR